MRLVGTRTFWKKLGSVGLSLSLAAFTPPQKEQLVELKGYLYGRSEAKFRTQDNNKVLVLQPKTRGLIKQTKKMESGNYAICLAIYNATDVSPDSDCVWVYYDVQNPVVQLYSNNDEAVKKQILEAWAKEAHNKVTLKKAVNVESAKAAMTTRETTAVVEKKVETAPAVASSGASTSKSADSSKKAVSMDSIVASKKGADSVKNEEAKETAKTNVKTIENLNKNLNTAMSKKEAAPNPACPDGKCNVKVETYPTCNGSNGYLEDDLQRFLNGQSTLAAFYNSSQKEIIRASCVKRNMDLFGAGRKFECTSSGAKRYVSVKACVSERNVNVTTKSFNLAADCFGNVMGDSESAKQQSALSVFALMAQESGMHMNVVSPSNAGGVGQLTDDAIKDVNRNLKSIRNKLNGVTKNPNCSAVLAKVFDSPMGASSTCDRLSIHEDNPLKNIAYSFAYQNIVRSSLDRARFLDNSTFRDVISKDLDPAQAARLKFSLVGWGHNTGPGGLMHPLTYLMRDYVRKGKIVRTSSDVDQFLAELGKYMRSHPHPKNRRRTSETSKYYSNIQLKMKDITKEPRSCLAN